MYALTSDIITQGGKILCFTDSEFRQSYIYSLSFLPMKLCSLPKAMRFSEIWNTLEHQDYVGLKLYRADNMMLKERELFFKWYRMVSDNVFDFKKELAEYCVNNIDILRKGCLTFRNEILKSTNTDPFKSLLSV